MASANASPYKAALGSHGYTTGQTNSSEEFTGDTTALNLKTITDS